MLFCEEALYVLVDFFITILTRNHKKDLKISYLALKYNH